MSDLAEPADRDSAAAPAEPAAPHGSVEDAGTTLHRSEHPIRVAADVLIAAAAADRIAERTGFPEPERATITLAVRELATNILRHASVGEIVVTGSAAGIEVVALDQGPGIPDVDEAVADGFSRDGGLGYGLGTVNRAMDELLITSARGKGTTVTARRRLRPHRRPAGRPPMDIGAATAPKPGYVENGDAYVIHQYGQHCLVGVIDGLGHGMPAQVAALAARRYVEAHADLPLDGIFRGTSIACRGSRGVVMALARFDWVEQTLEFASVGNIETRVLDAGRPLDFIVRRGVIGHNAPSPRITTHPWPPEATLVLHSDGIPAHWGDIDLAALAVVSASVMAATLLRQLNRNTDDATVLVARRVR